MPMQPWFRGDAGAAVGQPPRSLFLDSDVSSSQDEGTATREACPTLHDSDPKKEEPTPLAAGPGQSTTHQFTSDARPE